MLKFDYILLLFCSCHRKTAAIARVSTLKRLEEDEVDGIIARLWALTVLFLSKGSGYSDMVTYRTGSDQKDSSCQRTNFHDKTLCLLQELKVVESLHCPSKLLLLSLEWH